MSTATELRLLTLLNVSAVKRAREVDRPGGHRGSPISSRQNSINSVEDAGVEKLNGKGKVKRRKSVTFAGEAGPSGSGHLGKKRKGLVNGNGNGNGYGHGNGDGDGIGGKHDRVNGKAEKSTSDEGLDQLEVESDGDDEAGPSVTKADLFNVHFGPAPPILDLESELGSDGNVWSTEKKGLRGFGRCLEMRPGKGKALEQDEEIKSRITPSLISSLKQADHSPLVSTSLAHLGTYQDFYLHSLGGEADGTEKGLVIEEKEAMRKAAVVHALNHVLKTRRRIVRNNEKLAHATASARPAAAVPEPPRDQSFTRPKVLLLLPLRSLALHYLTTDLFPLAPAGTQIENQRPFTSSFSLPPEAGDDPLSAPGASKQFPIDHLVNFRGNSDDNFRFGIKITRKAWRVVMMPANESKLMECDILVASPLGMKMAAEREGSTDLLSSIEICLADGLDVMQMQNWEHVQFVFQNMNQIPSSPHGCDFSRVKPWYLESKAKFLRQTILLSRYDTPEARVLFNRHCHNLQGKIRSDRNDFGGVLGRVRPGVKQVFERIDLEGGKGMEGSAAVDEVEARLEWFEKKALPALLRSAVCRQNTIIVIPSYFDFVRVTNHLRKADDISFAAISEYSSNSEISRARTLFFKAKKSFLLVTERFHFYRRYRIRGAKTIVFYSLPEHAQFYSEYLETPFLPSRQGGGEEEAEVDEGEISSRVLFSRFDAMRLERVVGSGDCRRMLGSGEGRFEFI